MSYFPNLASFRHVFLGSHPSFLHILLKSRSKNKTECSCSGLTNSPLKDNITFHLVVPSWWVHMLSVIVLHCCFHALQSSFNVPRTLHPRNETFNFHAGFLIQVHVGQASQGLTAVCGAVLYLCQQQPLWPSLSLDKFVFGLIPLRKDLASIWARSVPAMHLL